MTRGCPAAGTPAGRQEADTRGTRRPQRQAVERQFAAVGEHVGGVVLLADRRAARDQHHVGVGADQGRLDGRDAVRARAAPSAAPRRRGGPALQHDRVAVHDAKAFRLRPRRQQFVAGDHESDRRPADDRHRRRRSTRARRGPAAGGGARRRTTVPASMSSPRRPTLRPARPRRSPGRRRFPPRPPPPGGRRWPRPAAGLPVMMRTA